MEIREIKSRLSILDVLTHYGLKPNASKMLCCPFHDDKTPSMQVYPETNTVFCFSSNCKLKGKAIDQIDFILHKEGCTKHEAILMAESLLGNAPAKENLNAIFAKLQTSLHNSKKAITYLESRNLYDVKIEAGYNDGIKYKPLKNCIVFPLKDQSGNISSLYGRSIINNDTAKHYYSKDRKGLYPGYPSQETTTLVLTESVIDTLTVNHYTNFKSLALYGTNGFTEEHEQAIRELKNLQEVVLFFDGDEAGRKAVEKYTEQLKAIKPAITISNVNTPEGEDPNSLLQSHEQEILTHLIESRTVIFSSNEVKHEPTTSTLSTGKLNTKNPDYITYAYEGLQLHVIGGIALYPLDKLKITLKIERKDSNSPLHSIRQSNLDLYSDEQLQKFIRSASERLEVGSKEMHLAIASLIGELEHYRETRIEEQKPKQKEKRIVTPEQRTKATNFLKSNNLLQATNELIAKSGVIGEEVNRLLMFLVFTSRLREQPLHIISLGASGTGKTYLQEKISELIPEEDKLEITTLSENALYYFDRKELQHKLVLIEDLDGAQDDKILYAIRELMSKKRISKTVPIKDSKGNLKTITITVEGPISLAGTTTREKLYEDNANRSLLIYLDNTQEHKNAIMEYQRKLSAGKINKQQEEEARELLQDVQSILQPVKVVNPYAEKLCIPETVFKPLRTNAHYLAFIETITFYHQFQREIKHDQDGAKYIETTLDDIEAANQLLKDVLLAKSDELTNACRSFLESIKAKLEQEKRGSFYKHEVREWMRINPHNLKYYLFQLLQYGYVKIVNGNKYKGYEYELTNREEYTSLSSTITNALDQALQQIRNEKKAA